MEFHGKGAVRAGANWESVPWVTGHTLDLAMTELRECLYAAFPFLPPHSLLEEFHPLSFPVLPLQLHLEDFHPLEFPWKHYSSRGFHSI